MECFKLCVKCLYNLFLFVFEKKKILRASNAFLSNVEKFRALSCFTLIIGDPLRYMLFESTTDKILYTFTIIRTWRPKDQSCYLVV